MKYLLIDGNNLAVRCAFANDKLTNSEGVSTGAQFGVIQSLNNLKRKFPEHQMLIVWDSKSKRRMAESNSGVALKIIPEPYKENRRKDELPKPLKDFYEHHAFLQKGIGTIGIPQIKIDGFEADDVIASYANLLKNDNQVVIVTSDKDYYQILDNNVSIWDGMKMEEMTVDRFKSEKGIVPSQWTHIGALMGDEGDNIYGIPGWGEKTSLKEIIRFGSWDKVISAYETQYQDLRKRYPDMNTLCGDEVINDPQKAFEEMANSKSDKGSILYPDINFDMPWTGVLYALYKGEIKITKTIIMALVFQDRIKLAYSLKKMDDKIPDLPIIKNEEFNKEKLTQFFEYYDIYSLTETYILFGDESHTFMDQAKIETENGVLDI